MRFKNIVREINRKRNYFLITFYIIIKMTIMAKLDENK